MNPKLPKTFLIRVTLAIMKEYSFNNSTIGSINKNCDFFSENEFCEVADI